MRTSATLVALALCAGCGPGSIWTTDVQDLRGIDSALWIEWSRERSGPDEVWHEFVMSSHGGLCRDLQDAMPKLSDLYDDLVDDLDNAQNDADECDALERFYDDASEVTDRMFRKPVTTLSLTLRDPDDDRDERPPEDTYDQGVDPDDPWFLGSLTITETNPYLELADVAGSCPDRLEDELEDALRDNVTRYDVDRGDVEAYERGDEAYRLKLDGEIEDDDGDNAGDIVARGSYRHCVVEWDGWFEPYDWGGNR